MWLYVIVLLTLALFYWWKNYAQFPCPNYPPGPMGLPLLGYLPIVTEENILVGLDKAHDQYGEVISINLGPGPRAVVIGDYDMLKEAFKDDKPAARPLQMMFLFAMFRSGDHNSSRGLLFSHGTEWTEQRRFALRRLRDFGLGKSSMEEMIQDEIILLCNSLDKQVGLPLAMDRIFNISVINALWTLISGSRFELDDPKLKKLIEYMDFLVKESGNTSILTVFPWIRHIAPKMSGWTGTKTCALALNHFIDEVIDEHVVNFASNKESVREDPKDFIDAFLAQIESSDPGSSFHGELGIKNLKATLLDLMLAGSETTATTLTWAILFMIKYPDIQRKVREEIVNEVGCSRPIRLDDKSRLPYTEAVIQEVLRMACVGPLGIPHYAQADIHIGQHVIPQGTTILPNIYRITRNPKVFTQPNIFNPKRFLDTQGKCIKNDHNAVFSVGKRDCLGKSLALNEMFLFFGSLIQRYEFKSVEKSLDLVDLKPIVTLTLLTKPFKVVLTKVQ